MGKLVRSKKGVVKARSARLMRKMIRHKKSLKRSQSESQDSERTVDVEQREEEEVVQREAGSDTAVTSSDDEEEEEEEEETVGAHSQLLSTISGLGRQKKRGQRSEATPTVSQYQLTSLAGGEVVSIGGLLGGLGEEGRGVGSLRRKLATASSHQLVPPATKQQVEKAHRALAYSSACEKVGKWLPIITHNRKAAHLSFPLQEATVPPPSLTSSTEDFKSVNDLEHAVSGVLGRSEAVIEAPDAELTAAERAQLVRVMGEEGRERVRESRRWRMLMSQYEAKCQRERRIKSRRFHKVQRKRREKGRVSGEEGEGGEDEKAERLRATERMTLRHSRQSKWAHEVLARKKDPAVMSALSEHSMRGRALTQHPTVESEEESASREYLLSSSDSGVEEGASNSPRPSHHHGNPWLDMSAPVLLLNSDPRQEKGVAEEDTELRGEEQEVNVDPSQELLEHEETSYDVISYDVISPPTKRQKLTSTSGARKIEGKRTVEKKQSSDVTSSQIDPTDHMSTQKVGGALGIANQQLLNVHEAFAGDDVVGDFAREKKATQETEDVETSLTLPGWGVWGGEGTRPVKKAQTKVKSQKKHRSDRELDHVIISDHGNVKINQHLVKKLPWPFSTSQQFNRSHITPLGRHWNSEVVYRQMVTPRVETGVGVAIPPLRLTDDVQDFMKRHSQDKAGRTRRSQDKAGRTQHSQDKAKVKQRHDRHK